MNQKLTKTKTIQLLKILSCAYIATDAAMIVGLIMNPRPGIHDPEWLSQVLFSPEAIGGLLYLPVAFFSLLTNNGGNDFFDILWCWTGKLLIVTGVLASVVSVFCAKHQRLVLRLAISALVIGGFVGIRWLMLGTGSSLREGPAPY